MTDLQVQDRTVATDGQTQSSVASTTQTVADPITGASSRQTSTRIWSGRNPVVEAVWLIAGIVAALLALDFVFHAFGANNVGFAAFIFSVGSWLAAPFAGIFNTSTAAPGNLVVWADLLAIVVYVAVAAVLAKVVGMAVNSRRA